MKDKKKNKSEAIPSNKEAVKSQFGHLIPFDIVEVPKEHRTNRENAHSLRCFRKIYQRDLERIQLKDLPKVRCKKHVVPGYLYCKFHGGMTNLPAVVEKRTTAQIYRQVYDAEMGDLLECFMNDPKLLDLKPDLANLRLVLNNYIKRLLEKPSAGSVAEFNVQATNIVLNEETGPTEKFNSLVNLVEGLNTLTNGRCIDRINRCVEQLGKIVDRIHKFEINENFLMTPDGLKLFLRALTEVLDKNIGDDAIKKLIRQELLTISVETSGDVTKYNFRNKDADKVVDAEVVQ